MNDMYAHYDRDANIAWFLFTEYDRARVDHSDEREWGLVDRDADGKVIGLEFWRASERLPAELLDALPSPEGEELVIARQPV